MVSIYIMPKYYTLYLHYSSIISTNIGIIWNKYGCLKEYVGQESGKYHSLFVGGTLTQTNMKHKPNIEL